MNININKDFEKEYKDDTWRGFSMKETVCIGCAVTILGVIAFCGYHYMGWPVNMSVYLGLPLAVPVLLYGFYRYQGMTLLELYREIRYERKIQHLTFEAGEYEPLVTEQTDRKKEKREKRKLAARKKEYKKQLRKGGQEKWAS